MKIEVAPWIRDYVVDMEELYTELKLDKNWNNKPCGMDSKLRSSVITETCIQESG